MFEATAGLASEIRRHPIAFGIGLMSGALGWAFWIYPALGVPAEAIAFGAAVMAPGIMIFAFAGALIGFGVARFGGLVLRHALAAGRPILTAIMADWRRRSILRRLERLTDPERAWLRLALKTRQPASRELRYAEVDQLHVSRLQQWGLVSEVDNYTREAVVSPIAWDLISSNPGLLSLRYDWVGLRGSKKAQVFVDVS